MSGPIVRTGATPEYWANWDQIFGGKSKKGKDEAAGVKKSGKKAVKKTEAKPEVKKKAAAKKTAKKKKK